MKKIQSFKSNKQGITSLLVVIGMAMIFIIIIVGLSYSSINELRQASANDFSNRALLAAQASARDASVWMDNNPGKSYPNCNGDGASGLSLTEANNLISYTLDSSTDNSTQIVCRTVATTNYPMNPRLLLKDQSDEVYLPQVLGTDALHGISLAWDTTPANSKLPANSVAFPALLGWSTTAPAALELTIIYWPVGTNAACSANNPIADASYNQFCRMRIQEVIILPYATPKVYFPSGFNSPNPIVTGSTDSCNLAKTNGYHCIVKALNLGSLILGNNNNPNLGPTDIGPFSAIIKIKPRYKDTNYSICFWKNNSGDCGTGNNMTGELVASSTASIDVTAKVGNYYRRVRATRPVTGISFSSSLIDDVLFSKNSKICKDMTVAKDPTDQVVDPNSC